MATGRWVTSRQCMDAYVVDSMKVQDRGPKMKLLPLLHIITSVRAEVACSTVAEVACSIVAEVSGYVQLADMSGLCNNNKL